jgi:CRP/FNR family cyclic AMP-dependent transcriptional regulator
MADLDWRIPMTIGEGARIDRLRAIDLFADMTDEHLAAVQAIATEVAVPAGRTIARQGDIGNGLFLIETGMVRVVRDGETVATLGPGEWFGELAVLDRGPRTASVIAEVQTTCLAIAAWDVERLLRAEPDLAIGLLRTLASRVRGLTEDHRH